MTIPDAGFPDRPGLREKQLNRLRGLLGELLPANRFYKEKFQQAGFDGRISSLDEFFARAPFTLKRELIEDQEQHPPYGTNLTYPLARYTRFNQTSGTTRAPMRWLDTPESWAWMLGNWDTVYRAAGVGADDHIFFAFSFGPFLGFWTAFESAVRMGAMCIPGGGMRSVPRLHSLIETGATVLCCTPTYAIRLGEVAAGESVELADGKVRRIIVAGEPGGSIPATRARIEQRWPGARVVDHHGMTEAGPVSYECPRHSGTLHIIEPEFIAEVLVPESTQPAQPGAPGELVLTNLGRTGSPLLRYRTGDIVRASSNELCSCGSSALALEGGILGRTDDMAVVRGVNIYPSTIEQIVRSHEEIAEYRVEIRAERGLAELMIQIEPASAVNDPAGLARRLEAEMSNILALRLRVSLAPAGSLPRFEMKAQRWVRL
jgi:phenylacetate-CoA ligase